MILQTLILTTITSDTDLETSLLDLSTEMTNEHSILLYEVILKLSNILFQKMRKYMVQQTVFLNLNFIYTNTLFAKE